VPQQEGWFALDSIDLTGVGYVTAFTGWQNITPADFELEARLDAPDGKLLGKGKMTIPKKDEKKGAVKIPLEAITDSKLHKLYFIYKPQPGKAVTGTGISNLRFDPK
jgi:hypothetical protein